MAHHLLAVRLEMVERVLIAVGLAGLREEDQCAA
jgi:hypothetical protein